MRIKPPSRATSILAAAALVVTIGSAGAAVAASDSSTAPVMTTMTTTTTVAPVMMTPDMPTSPEAEKHKEALRLEVVKGGAYKYGDPLPMGPHANWTPLWWGMQFTLDATATQELIAALDQGSKISDLVSLLATLGLPIGPAVSAILTPILAIFKAAIATIKSKATADGVVINSLWLPIPWVTSPTQPFTPAPPR